MGAASSQPAHVVEVRIEAPAAKYQHLDLLFYAYMQTAADGPAAYTTWGTPQEVGLWADDVITIGIVTARSDEDFEKGRTENFAEVHLPWELIGERVTWTGGAEECFTLGLMQDSPSLGQHASPTQYKNAFRYACGAAAEDPTIPFVKVGVRKLVQGRGSGSGAPASSSLWASRQMGLPPDSSAPGALLLSRGQVPRSMSGPIGAVSPRTSPAGGLRTPRTPPTAGVMPGSRHGGIRSAPPLYVVVWEKRARKGAKLDSDMIGDLIPVGTTIIPIEACRLSCGVERVRFRYHGVDGWLSVKNECGQEVLRPTESITASVVAKLCTSELGPEDLEFLRRLKEENQELVAELSQMGLKRGDWPEVDLLLQKHLELLRSGVCENYELRADLQEVDKELALFNADFTQDQWTTALMQSAHLPRSRCATPVRSRCASPVRAGATPNKSGDDEEDEKMSKEVMLEIQGITQANIELIAIYDKQVKQLEDDLVQARHRQAEMSGEKEEEEELQQTLDQQCELLRELLAEIKRFEFGVSKEIQFQRESEEAAQLEGARSKKDLQQIQQIQLEHEVQREQIGHLRKLLVKAQQDGLIQPPDSAHYIAEVDLLEAETMQVKSRGEAEQAALARHVVELRQELRELKQALPRIAEERAAAEKDAQDPQGGGHKAEAAERQERQRRFRELQEQEMALQKDGSRCRSRNEALESKIGQLNQEAEDLRARASRVSASWKGAAAAQPRGAELTSLDSKVPMQVVRLQAEVSGREAKLQKAREEEAALLEEMQQAQRELEELKVEGSVAEARLKLLSHRTGSSSPEPKQKRPAAVH